MGWGGVSISQGGGGDREGLGGHDPNTPPHPHPYLPTPLVEMKDTQISILWLFKDIGPIFKNFKNLLNGSQGFPAHICCEIMLAVLAFPSNQLV